MAKVYRSLVGFSAFVTWSALVSSSGHAADAEKFREVSVDCPGKTGNLLQIFAANDLGQRERTRIWYRDGRVIKVSVGVAEKEGPFEDWARVDLRTEWFSGPGTTQPIGDLGRKMLKALTDRGSSALARHCNK